SSIQEKAEHLPGVKAAGFTSDVPLTGFSWGDGISFREIPRRVSEEPVGEFRFVSPEYFRTIGLPLVTGRFLAPGDSGQSVAMISESVARKVLAGRDPLGMQIDCSDFAFGPQKWCRVVGVVGDIRDDSDQAPVLAAYFPLWLYSSPSETLVVRTEMDPAPAADAIRQAIWSVDPDLAVPHVRTLKTIMGSAEAPRRYETSLAALFAFCAAFLAMLGLYGVISFSVSQRGHEIGVRMALGAQRADVLRAFMREAMLLTGAGIAFGVAVALAITQLLRSFLFEIQPTDPATFASVAILLTTGALAACWIPARRATRGDPMVALRYE
ncbi:MAG: FtsX-like permease family protein, partial [Candidatus Acidiferrum sp.]